jgi:hypothetical protein
LEENKIGELHYYMAAKPDDIGSGELEYIFDGLEMK